MTRPILELVVGAEPTGWVQPLLGPLQRWCEPRAGHPSLPRAGARLAVGLDAPDLDRLLDESDIPLALATLEPESVGDSVRSRAAAIVTTAGSAADAGVLALPERSVDVRTHAPVSPFVRARWRRRLGLSHHTVVDLREGLPGGDVPVATVVALAAAIVASDDTALLALALGTPTVFESGTADRLGLDTHTEADAFVVESAENALPRANLLADDLSRAAGLGRRARRLAEESFSTEGTARSLAGRLGMTTPAPPGLTGVARALDELRTSSVSPPALRAFAALGPVVDQRSLAEAGAGR